MKTIYQLQQTTETLRATTETASISPEDAFGLQADVLEYLADMEQNAEGLGIHGIYSSYDEMVADASAPVGSNKKPLRFGQLVVIYDASDNTKPETGNIYAWQKGNTGEDAWLLMGNMKGIHEFSMKIDTLSHNVAIEEKAREEVDANLQDSIDAEAATREVKDAELEARIEAEKNAREEADANLQDSIDAEAATREVKDAELEARIEAEKNAREEDNSAMGDKMLRLETSVPNQIRTGYSDDGVCVDLYHDNKSLWTDTIEPATRELAGVMSAEDKRKLDAALYQVDDTDYFPDYVDTQIRGYDGDGHSVVINAATEELAGVMSAEDKIKLRTLGERIETVNDAVTIEGTARKTADTMFNTALADEQQVREYADGKLQDAINNEASEREKAVRLIKQELDIETMGRNISDDEIRNEMANLRSAVPNDIHTDYSNDGVSIDLRRDSKQVATDTIEPATRELAGVMSAEDKRKLDAALYQVDDTDYFPDYVETQIRGYDGDGHSVVINAATEELAGVMSAEDKIKLRSLGERIEEVNYAVTEAITGETSRAEKEEQGLGQRIDDLGDNVTTSRVNITDGSGRQMFHFNATSNGTMQFVSDEGDGFMFKDETDTVGTTRVSVSAKGGVNVLSTRQVQVASDNGISLRSSSHRVSLRADNDILSLYGKSLQAGTDSASVAMDNGGNVDINAAAMEYKVAGTWHLRTVSDGTKAYHVLVEQGQVKFRCSEDASLAIDGENGRINAVAGDFRFVFKDGTEREVLLSELLDCMAALERESSSLRTDVEYLKENGGSIGGSGSHSVEGEMLIVGSDGEISKVSQLENDKGYLTGSVNADKIILLDD